MSLATQFHISWVLSCLQPSSQRGLVAPWTSVLQTSLSLAIWSSWPIPHLVHNAMLLIQDVLGLPRLCVPGMVPCIMSSRHSPYFAHNMPKISQFSSFNRFEQTLFNSCCLTDPVIRFSGGPWNLEDLSQALHFEGICSLQFLLKSSSRNPTLPLAIPRPSENVSSLQLEYQEFSICFWVRWWHAVLWQIGNESPLCRLYHLLSVSQGTGMCRRVLVRYSGVWCCRLFHLWPLPLFCPLWWEDPICSWCRPFGLPTLVTLPLNLLTKLCHQRNADLTTFVLLFEFHLRIRQLSLSLSSQLLHWRGMEKVHNPAVLLFSLWRPLKWFRLL